MHKYLKSHGKAICACSLVFLAIALFKPVSSIAINFPGAVHGVQGIATTKDGKPLANARLFLPYLPPANGQNIPASQLTVVTDASGHFIWDVPESVVVLPKNGTSAPSCWALASSPSQWDYSLRIDPRYGQDFQRQDLLRTAVRECTTSWLSSGSSPVLGVIAPDMGVVSMVVSGPDGTVLSNHSVQVFSVGSFSDVNGAVVYEGKTDGAGRVNIRWYTGLLRLQIFAPGVGFTSTGTFAVLPSQTVTPQIPALAPFARVSGTVASGVAAGSTIRLDNYWALEHRWYKPSASVNNQGQWSVADILPGDYQIILHDSHGDKQVAHISLRAGEDRSGIEISAPAPVAHSSPLNSAFSATTFASSVYGGVTDTSGRPIVGAKVYAACFYDQSMRGHLTVLSATTDSLGQYTIAGLPADQRGPSVLMFATHAGFGHAKAASVPNRDGSGADLNIDLVLPPPTAGLKVQVLQGGQLAANAIVRVTPKDGTGLGEMGFTDSEQSPARDALAAVLAPTVTADAEGNASFMGLAPGLYDVTATAGKSVWELDRMQWPVGRGMPAKYGVAHNVVVRAGNTEDFTLNVRSQPDLIHIKVMGSDGKAPANPRVEVTYKLADNMGESGDQVTLDTEGIGAVRLPSLGLWQVQVRYRDVTTDGSLGANAEPYYSAESLVGTSPAISENAPLTVHTMRHGPGRIRVHLENTQGRPERGSVIIGDSFDSAEYGASVDSSGNATFADMTSGQYNLTASTLGSETIPRLGSNTKPFPTDAAMTGVTMFEPQKVVVLSDQDTQATFRAQLEGYVRGYLRMPGSLAKYAFYSPTTASVSNQPLVRIDPLTGEFVAGPFPAAHAQFILSRSSESVPEKMSRWSADVKIDLGKVATVNFAPEGMAPDPGQNNTVMKPMNDTFPDLRDTSIVGTVLLPDGTSPAWGARVALVLPEPRTAMVVEKADAMGRLGESRYWNGGDASLDSASGNPSEPILVAWLPGSNGAAIMPYVPGHAVRFTLPPSQSVRGQITIGGKSAAGTNSSFRVLAAYQGRGRLNELLSVDETAQADGSFTLTGLTKGTYRVQAVRDGIWLSDSQTLVVGANKIADIKLDIPLPGQAVDLHIGDSAGKSIPGAVVALVPPGGPLDNLWPKALVADGAGDLHLEGLVAGRQRLIIYPARASTFGAAGGIIDLNATKPLGTIKLDIPQYEPGSRAVQKTATLSEK